MKKIFSLFAAVLFAGSMAATEVMLTNANIKNAGDGASGYQAWEITDDASRTWNAYAIKNKHSNATAQYHYLQIKKYGSNTAYYIEVPDLGEAIQSITMTVSGASKPMDGGANGATIFFSASNETSAAGAGVASGTGDASVTIDASELGLTSGFITAGGAVRIWDVTITTGTVTPPTVEKPTFSLAEGTYTEAKSVELACATEGAKIYYSLDAEKDLKEYTEYASAIALNERGSYTIKAYAVLGTDTSKVASATYVISLPWVFASLEALVASEAQNGDAITVSFDDVEITDVYETTKDGYRYGIYLDVKAANDKDIEIFYNAAGATVQVPAAWQVGGKVSGTIQGTWTYYSKNTQWEVVPSAADWAWTELTYKDKPTAVENIEENAKAVKFFENGQLVIIKNGVKYNATGAIIK